MTLASAPQLAATVQGTALLRGTEAAICIRDPKAGRRWSVEAVNEYGGTREVLVDARNYRKLHAR